MNSTTFCILKKGKNLLINKNQFFLEKLKCQLNIVKIFESKLVPKLKMVISCLISLEILRKGRRFSDGVYIKQFGKFIVSSTLLTKLQPVGLFSQEHQQYLRLGKNLLIVKIFAQTEVLISMILFFIYLINMI